MPATNQFESDLLDLLFTNVTAPNIGDGTGIVGGTVGNIELALSTGTLGETDTLMTATEVAYTGYARPTIVRSAAGWSVSGTTQVANDSLIQFGEMTAGGPDTVLDLALTFDSAGDYLQIYGVLDNSLVINNGVNPQFVASALVITLT